MPGKPAPKDIYFDFLTRVVELEKLETWIDREGNIRTLQNAVPRQFTPIVGPYPMLLNWVSRAIYERGDMQSVKHNITLSVQCIGGPIGAGYAAEAEDNLNMMFLVVPQLFEENPFLKLNGSTFDYIYQRNGVQPRDAPIGMTAFEVNDGDKVTRYFATLFTFGATLHIPKQRKG